MIYLKRVIFSVYHVLVQSFRTIVIFFWFEMISQLKNLDFLLRFRK